MRRTFLTSEAERDAVYEAMKLSLKDSKKPTRYKRALKCVIADIYGNFGQAKRKPKIPVYEITDVKADRALGLLLKHTESCPVQHDLWDASTSDPYTFQFGTSLEAKIKPLRTTDKEKQEPKYPSGKWLFRLLESCGWLVIEFRPRHDGIEFIVRKLEDIDFAK